jgi:hypothetical protein
MSCASRSARRKVLASRAAVERGFAGEEEIEGAEAEGAETVEVTEEETEPAARRVR